MWDYQAKFVKALTANRIVLRIDLGFRLYYRLCVTLNGVDAPRLHEPGYLEARQFIERWFEVNGPDCMITTFKTGNSGRWLANVYPTNLPNKIGKDPSLNTAMLEASVANVYKSRSHTQEPKP